MRKHSLKAPHKQPEDKSMAMPKKVSGGGSHGHHQPRKGHKVVPHLPKGTRRGGAGLKISS